MKITGSKLLLMLCVMLMPVLSQASTLEFGLRGGKDSGGNDENFTLLEASIQKPCPWQKQLGIGVLQPRWNLGLGYLEAASEGSALLSAGGDLAYEMAGGLLAIDIGLRPILISDHTFGDENLGGALQFGSHAGVTLNVDRFTLSYRFEHISNAGIYGNNPGINMHLIGVGARF
jgi:hypothetical protein